MGDPSQELHAETLAVFDRVGAPGTPLTTREVADALGCTRRTAYDRLERLVDRGDVETKKVGARGRVWWRPSAPGAADDPEPAGDPATADDPGPVDDPGPAGLIDGDDAPGRALAECERELRDQRDLTERILETVPVGIAIVGPDGEIERLNSRARRRLGVDDPDSADVDRAGTLDLYDRDGDAIRPEDRPSARVFETGEAVADRLVQYDRGDGERRWARLDAAPLLDEAGDVERVVVAARDVTELKRTERELARERDGIASELDRMFERIDDAFVALDEEWNFTYINERAHELINAEGRQLEGKNVWAEFPAAEGRKFEEQYERAMYDQETVSFEEYYPEPLDTWYEVTAYPSETGLSVYFRDVTGRKEREQELARYETLFEESKDVNVVVDAAGRFQYLTPSAANVFGYDPEELVGEVGFEYIHPDDREEMLAEFTRMIETPGYEPSVEFRFRHGDGSWIVLEALARNLLDDPDIEGAVIYTRDVTDRKERERDLERYETIVEAVDDGVYAADEEYRFAMVNDAYAEMTGYDREELLGEHISRVVDDDTVALGERLREELLDGETRSGSVELEITTAAGDPLAVESRYALLPGGDGFGGTVGVVRDITDRRERERALAESERRYRTLAENFPEGAVGLFDDECRYTVVGGEALAEMGLPVESVEGMRVREVFSDDPAFAERLEAAYVDALDGTRSSFETEYADRVWMINVRPVTDEDGRVRGGINTAVDVTERVERERALESQRERLAALDELNGVVREINEALVEQSTREEIERVVCERLAASDSYAFAWIGALDPRSDEIVARVEAGVEGYLDEILLSTDPDETAGRGPGGTAARTGETQVVRDARDDPEFEPLAEFAERYGYRSLAAIPIVHEGTVYGVLGVYTERSEAFADEERAVIGQLGETIGHAIGAVERKHALMSDEVVELEFAIRDVFEFFGVPGTDGVVSFEQVVPVGGGRYVVYGTASEAAIETLEAIREQLPDWQAVTVLDRQFGEARFELRLAEPPVVSAAASHGGSIEAATMEDGDYHLTVHLPPSVDVRHVIDAVQAAYPPLELKRRRQVTRRRSRDRVGRTLAEELTDRQRAALEASFHAGYFDWPRESSGEDVAETLGISPPTFHQHLRIAQRKLLGTVLS